MTRFTHITTGNFINILCFGVYIKTLYWTKKIKPGVFSEIKQGGKILPSADIVILHQNDSSHMRFSIYSTDLCDALYQEYDK